jgi:Tat protein secretion system quality control protein TatD with DNase activity
MSKKFLFELSGVILAEKEHPELLVPAALPEEPIVTEADSPSVSDPVHEPEIEARDAGAL